MANLYRIARWSGKTAPGASSAQIGEIGIFAKCNTSGHPYTVANEYICSELARAICLPVPPAGLMTSSDDEAKIWFANINFNPRSDTTPPIEAQKAALNFASVCCGIIVFDIWVLNDDRKSHNLAYDLDIAPKRIDVYDHSHALLGPSPTNVIAHLSSHQATLVNNHCLIPAVTADHFGEWLDRIASVPDFYIREICAATIGAGITVDESSLIQNFLIERKTKLKDIIQAHQKSFSGITDWVTLRAEATK